ncbi:uncharacterized protein LOC119100256 [Pollicipes pollicipes]|uniref:uncharacterized protein LOC119100256 n=1 Tax=Pollicipes pollicipes TaxID=41117 RepID=UPI0018849844|nr:uncharacterized protein LOC119100256 [Pollicipes pollicipes]
MAVPVDFESLLRDVHAELVRRDRVQAVTEQFARLPTDLERARLVLALPEALPLRQLRGSDSSRPKSAADSDALRAAGNTCFGRGEYAAALRTYTEAAMRAPPAPAPQLSLALANRSAAFFQLGQYGPCQEDVARALGHFYPAELRYKLQERLALPAPSYGRSQTLPAASAAVELASSPDRGRMLVANRDLQPGDVVIVERALCWTALPEAWSSHCYHCCRRLEAGEPCPACCSVLFCSEWCRAAAAPLHRLECGLLNQLVALDVGPMALLALRLVSELRLAAGGGGDGAEGASPSPPAAGLVGHTERRSVADLFRRTATAVCLAELLHHTNLAGSQETDGSRETLPETNRAQDMTGKIGIPLVLPPKENGSQETKANGCNVMSPEKIESQEMSPQTKGSHDTLPRCLRGKGKALPKTTGSQDTLPETNGSPETPPKINGSPGTPPEASDSQAAPPETNGSPETPPETNGSQGSPPETNGSKGSPPDTGGSPETPPETNGPQGSPPGTGGSPETPPETNDLRDTSPAAPGDGETAALEETAAVLLHYLQSLPCNAHEVSEQVRCGSDSELREVGAAVYPTVSLLNHSCDPNVLRVSHGTSCVVHVIRPVPAGHELLDNYGYHWAVQDWTERQEALRKQYHFACHCRACTEDWAPHNELPEREFFRCELCDAPPLYCYHEKNKVVVEEFNRSRKAYLQALGQLKQDGTPMDVQPLIRHLVVMDRVLARPSRDFNKCQEAIKLCFFSQGNCYHESEQAEKKSESATSAREPRNCIERLYGKNVSISCL